jgi:hypothetical protein
LKGRKSEVGKEQMDISVHVGWERVVITAGFPKKFASKRNEAKRDPFRFLSEYSSEKQTDFFAFFSLISLQTFYFISTCNFRFEAKQK